MKSVNFWPDATAQATLLRRERQQAVLLRLSRLALEGSLSLDDLLNQTVQLVAECLGVDYCKIMEVLPGRDLLQVRAGVGWRPGIVGVATVSASRESQAGMTLEHDGPTVIDDLTTDWRISGPPLLIEHEIRSGVSCVIRGRDGNAWGVIGAHTKKRRNFEADEADFLQSIADTLAALFQRHTAEANARWQERQYRTVVNALPMLIAYITPDHVYRYANATYEAWLGLSPEDVVGRTLPDVLGEKSWEVSRKPVERALAGAPQTYDNTMIGPDGSVRAVQVNLVPDAADDGHCHGIFALAFDVTDRRAREEQNHLVAGELNHRVKNMLARVQSIVRQTARRSNSLEEFVEGLTPRLRSLGTANELLTRSDWSGAELHDVVATAAASAGVDDSVFAVEGAYVMLRPRAVLALHLVMHEMFTNALKYGSLSTAEGRVTLRWEVISAGHPTSSDSETDASSATAATIPTLTDPAAPLQRTAHSDGTQRRSKDRFLRLCWTEDGGPPPSVPIKSGFGSHVIRRSVQYDLNGTVEINYERADGLKAEFVFALSQPSARLAVV